MPTNSPLLQSGADAAADATSATPSRGARLRAPVTAALSKPSVRVALLALAAIASVALFMFVGITGSWDFAIPFRGRKVAAMVLVAVAIGVSTVLFQTITANRILTPSIMGFDALYLLVQTLLMFVFGVSAFTSVDSRLVWLGEVALMVGFAGLLFRWLFVGAKRSIYLLVLVGIVFGVFFRSLSSMMQRMLDPAAFAVLQDSFFATFNAVDPAQLWLSAVAVIAVCIVAMRMLPVLDVLNLGEEQAIALGVNHRRTVTILLVLIAILVAVSTSLVGPITFFGLIVANLAYIIIGSSRHALVLPATVLLGVICLVGGQFVLEQVFGLGTVLSVVIEFAGGILFIALLVRKGIR